MSDFDLIDLRTRNPITWIEELFIQKARPGDGTLLPGKLPVFVCSGYELDAKISFFRNLDKANLPFVLVHTSDESYDNNLSVYEFKMCLAVFRNYFRFRGGLRSALRLFAGSLTHRAISRYDVNPWRRTLYKILYDIRDRYPSAAIHQSFPRLPAGKVYPLPLGYLDTIAAYMHADKERRLPVDQRPFKWSFTGDTSKRDRTLMVNLFNQHYKGLLHCNSSWQDSRQISHQDYWNSLCQSVFIPCPMGYINLETARVYEALEAGAIPLLLRSHAYQPYPYFDTLWGPHPVPVFDTWNSAIKFVSSLSDEGLCDLARRVQEWYSSYKATLAQKIEAKLNSLLVENKELLPRQVVHLPVH